jgi:hypothetical protein
MEELRKALLPPESHEQQGIWTQGGGHCNWAIFLCVLSHDPIFLSAGIEMMKTVELLPSAALVRKLLAIQV